MLEVNNIGQYTAENIITMDEAIKKIAELKKTKTVGLCNGGMDLLHAGHIKHFESAKKLCDVLFVSVTCDKFVTERKGESRPIFNEKLRSYSIVKLSDVDFVIISPFKTGVEAITKLKPSFYIKGPDYINKQTPGIIAEREAITNVGGEIKYTNDPKMSTSEIIDYIKSN